MPCSIRLINVKLIVKMNFISSSIYPEQIKLGDIPRLKDCLKFVYGPRMEQNLDVEFNKMVMCILSCKTQTI